MIEYLYSILVIVLFCLGWNTITQQGMIFYFLRRPFEGLFDEITNKEAILKSVQGKRILEGNEFKLAKSYLRNLKVSYYIVKPIVLCITCMASVWGIPIYLYLNGFNAMLFPAIISASFIQTFIWNLYDKYL